jgi:hypothetical protein
MVPPEAVAQTLYSPEGVGQLVGSGPIMDTVGCAKAAKTKTPAIKTIISGQRNNNVPRIAIFSFLLRKNLNDYSLIDR